MCNVAGSPTQCQNAERIAKDASDWHGGKLLEEVRCRYGEMWDGSGSWDWWPTLAEATKQHRKSDSSAEHDLPEVSTLFPQTSVDRTEAVETSADVQEQSRGAWSDLLALETVTADPSDPPPRKLFKRAARAFSLIPVRTSEQEEDTESDAG